MGCRNFFVSAPCRGRGSALPRREQGQSSTSGVHPFHPAPSSKYFTSLNALLGSSGSGEQSLVSPASSAQFTGKMRRKQPRKLQRGRKASQGRLDPSWEIRAAQEAPPCSRRNSGLGWRAPSRQRAAREHQEGADPGERTWKWNPEYRTEHGTENRTQSRTENRIQNTEQSREQKPEYRTENRTQNKTQNRAENRTQNTEQKPEHRTKHRAEQRTEPRIQNKTQNIKHRTELRIQNRTQNRAESRTQNTEQNPEYRTQNRTQNTEQNPEQNREQKPEPRIQNRMWNREQNPEYRAEQRTEPRIQNTTQNSDKHNPDKYKTKNPEQSTRLHSRKLFLQILTFPEHFQG